MKRYRVESRSGKNHFRADCTEEELEYKTKRGIKYGK